MADKEVKLVRTVIMPQGYARGVIDGFVELGYGVPEKDDVGVLYAQWMMETGGASCWNWNIGNAKYTPGCGFDFICLNGVWEGVPPVTAGNLIAAGRAISDPSPDHATAVGPGKVSVIFPPPQPESRFRAFPDLATGMMAHLKLLHDRFAAAWPHILAGEANAAGHMLGTLRYFTANADVYGAGMQRFYDAFMLTSAYELAMAETEPVDITTDEEETGSGPILHPLTYDVDAEPDGAA